MIARESWIWLPYASHFICGYACRFHMATKVGPWLISTVGDYFPPAIIGVRLSPTAAQEVGPGRTHETMVFRAKKVKGCSCWEQSSGESLDFAGYKDHDDAFKGHMKMCRKWAKITKVPRHAS